MEAVSALRIELYNELQGLPEALRSDFPDLAVDFLATVFRPAGTVSPAKPTQSARPADPPTRERRAPLSQFRLLPPSATDDKDALAVDGRVQDMLEAVQREAASIEATAGATPATGWGDLALPLVVAPVEQLKQLTAQQRSVGGRRSPSPAVGRPLPPPPPPAQLLECRRCRKVLMACAAVQHQRQCSQLPEATVAQPGGEASLSPSEGRSSSDGVPAPAPSASRGSKRKRPSGSVAPGGAKASRMSKGGSMRAGSVELTPSIGEVVQGKLQPPVQPLVPAQAALAAPPPEVVAAVTAAPQAFPSGLPPDVAAAFALPADVMTAFGVQPSSTDASMQAALAAPAAVVAAFAPAAAAPAAPAAVVAAFAPAAAAAPAPPPAAAPEPAADASPSGDQPRAPLSPTIRLTQQQRRPRSQHPPRLKRRLLHLHPARDLAQPLVLNEVDYPAAKRQGHTPASDTAAAAAAAAVNAEPAAAAATGRVRMMPPATAAAAAAGGTGMLHGVPPNQGAHFAGSPGAAARMPGPQATAAAAASAGQQQPGQPQAQGGMANPGVPHMQPTAQQVTAQQQQARAQRYYEQCRIFSSLGPDQQQRLRQIATQRQKTQAAQQQQQQQQQGQAGGQPPGPAAQPMQPGSVLMASPGAAHYQPGMAVQGVIQQQMPQQTAATAQHVRPQQQQQQQQPGMGAAPYAVVGMAVHPTAGTVAATVGVPLGGAGSPGMSLAMPGSMPSPAGSRPFMVPQQQLMMMQGMAMPLRPGMMALPAGTAALPAGAVRPAGIALPGQLQHMQQQMVRPGMQVRPVGLPGYPAARLPAGLAQQHAYPAGMMVVPAGFAMGVPFGGSPAPGAGQAAASPAGARASQQLADTASSPPAVPQQPTAQYHPFVRPAVVAGMPAAVGVPAAVGMPLPFASIPAQPLAQQPGAAAPSMHFVPNR